MNPGRAGLAAPLLGLVLLAACSAGPEATRRSVVLVVVDTLRKDHLHLYGYPRRTSDAIDALGEAGWVFEHHVANASQTVPSTLSLLLSVYPAEHGFVHRHRDDFVARRPRYPESFLFLAEVFLAAGYETAGFVGNSFLRRENGFAQGFDTFAFSGGRGEELTRPALAWLAARSPERPFFLYLHYFDPHFPYDPPPDFRGRFWQGEEPPARIRGIQGLRPSRLPEAIALYDAEVAYVDSQIAALVSGLERLGLRDDTILAITSDHGEEFLEHGGVGHGSTVYGELVRVPFVLVDPRAPSPGRRVTHLTHHVDVAPTLLTLAGLEPPGAYRGGSLLEPAPEAFAENGSWRAVYRGERKAVVERETGRFELFDRADEHDQRPLRDDPAGPELASRLERYRVLEASAPRAGEGDPHSAGEIERLRALGYGE